MEKREKCVGLIVVMRGFNWAVGLPGTFLVGLPGTFTFQMLIY